MTELQQLITVLIVSAGLIFTRFIIFWLFPSTRKPPAFMKYLGSVLPASAIALILVYSLKDVEWTSAPYGIPEIIGIVAVVLLQKVKQNTLISVFGGTALYMFLVQYIF
ncbi:MAG TPA: AzlD domain-containing protein [Atopostipes sp.]|nr:AzlD domain-containing protein [Atopostipes sp.]